MTTERFPAPASWGYLLLIAVSALAAAIGVGAALSGQIGIIALVVGPATLAFLALAVVRFEYFLLSFVVVRSAVDLTRTVLGTSEGTSSLPASALALLVVAAGTLWLLAQYSGGRLRRPSGIAFALFALAAVGVVSAVLSLRPVESLPEAARFLSAVAFFIVLEQVFVEERGARRLLGACALSLAVPLVVGSAQLFTGPVSRIEGSFTHPNTFGIYLALTTVVGAAVIPHLQRGRQPVGYAILAWSTGLLILTYSRGSLLALVLGLCVVAALQSRWIFAALGTGILASPVLFPSVLDRLGDLTSRRNIYGGPGSNSVLWRFDQWSDMLGLYEPAVALTGIGPRMTQFIIGNLPHNDFIRMLVELGLLGLLAYIAVWVLLFRDALRVLHLAPDGPRRGAAVGMLGCCTAMLGASVGGNQISQLVVLGLFLALVVGTRALAQASRTQGAALT